MALVRVGQNGRAIEVLSTAFGISSIDQRLAATRTTLVCREAHSYQILLGAPS